MKIGYLIIVVFIFFSKLSFSQDWVNFYNGEGNSDDQVTAICSDDSGNVYVTGFSVGLNSNYDIVTIKYNRRGIALWIRRYDGGSGGDDKALGIIIDNDGFIYVGGYATTSSGNKEDFILIKYNPAGAQIWAKNYNGGNGFSDKAFGIAIDNSSAENNYNYIYLTGYSYSASNYDYKTVKFKDDGTVQWSKSYDGGQTDQAWGIVVDATGYVVVTGFSELVSSSFDYYTIKYSSEGSVSWSRRYNGPANGEDRAFGVVVDSEKNYTISGYSLGGNPPYSFDIATTQYDKNGAVKWTKRFDGNNLDDRPFGIAIDNSNNIIIAGYTKKIETSEDFITIKYGQTGVQNWAASYNNNSNSSDIAYGVSISNNGNQIFVVGSSLISGTGEKPLALKYNSNGVLQQSALYHSNGRATCVDVSNPGNLFISGYYASQNFDNSQYNDFITMEFTGGILILIGIKNINNNIPDKFQLFQNYPNPFNPSTAIRFNIAKESFVEISVFDILGKEIGQLLSEKIKPGEYELEFDAGNLTSGVYFYTLRTENFNSVKKMVLIK
ncbi:MAG: T9SS type A sorting domain-containing protein [Chlorobi bacterium]|nr:T9SS type A sorting domain-containing protein [Chlorobiota bacterium]MCI0715108.1 T9SS type A sorting domain-containing protein [Chlorobiota bacterium]